MPGSNESTMKWKVDIAQLKAGMQEAKRSISLANAEFKNATAGLGKWQNSITGVEAKIKQLGTTQKSQKAILQSLEKQYATVTKAQGADSAEAQRLKIQIENQQAAIKKTDTQLATYNTKLGELKKEQQQAQSPMGQLNAKIAEQESQLSDLKDEYKNAVLQYGKNSDEAKKLAKEIDSLSSELQENKQKLNEADDAADEFDNSLDDMADSIDDAGGKLDAMTVAFGNLIAQGISMAIGAMKDFAASVVETGKNFDSSMSSVAALSGATGDELSMLRDTAKDFGSSTMFSASQAADALGYMALAGWDANTSASALGGVLDLAASSGMELGAASDMVTDYMSAFSMKAEESAYFADLLAYAQANANTTAAGLGEAFKNSAANMNAAGQDIETTTALLSMMANQGLKGSEAGTALTAVMRDMTAKMKDGKIAIGDASVAVMDSSGNYRDMTDILKDVSAATDGLGDAEKATALMSTFTSDSIKGLNLILNAGVDNAEAFEAELRTASFSVDSFGKMADEAGIDVDGMKTAFENAGVSAEDFDAILAESKGSADLFIEGLGEAVNAGENAEQIMKDLGIATADLQGAMDETKGAAGAMADVMTDNLGGDMTALGSKFEGVQIAIYEKFEPALRKGAEIIDKLLDGLGSIDLTPVADALETGFSYFLDTILPAIKAGFDFILDNKDAIIAAFVGIAAGVGAYTAYTTALNIMNNGLKALTIVTKLQAAAQWVLNAAMSANPIGILIAAIAALVAAFVYLWNTSEGFRNFWLGLWETIKDAAGAAWSAITGFFSEAWESIKATWGAVSDWFAGVWDGIKAVFAAVGDWFKEKFTAAWTNIKLVWNLAKAYFTNIWTGIKAVFNVVGAWFKEKFTTAWNNIKAIWGAVKGWFSGVWTGIKNVFSGVGGWFKSKFQTAWTNIKNVFKGWGSFFGNLWTQIKTKFTNIGTSIANAISGAVRSGINGVISGIERTINSGIGLINGAINLINKLPGVSVGHIGTVSFPRLARGGVVRGAQMAMIGEDGAEAVVPLERNTQWIAKVAADMIEQLNTQSARAAVAGSLRFGGGIGGGALSRNNNQTIIFNQTNTSPQALSRLDVYRDTKSLLFSAKVGLANV